VTDSPQQPADGVGPLLGRLVGDLSRSAPLDAADRRTLLRELGSALTASAKHAGAGAVASGRWLADVVTEALPYLPLREEATLRGHHPGRSTEEVADALVRNAARATGAVGALGGGISVMHGPASLITVPVQLAAETALMSLIEVKLVGELHEVYGVGVSGSAKQRAAAYLVAWANRRGIDPTRPGSAPAVLGVSTRRIAALGLRRRAGRSFWSLLPLFLGAAMGAQANHRETRRLAESVRADLRNRRPLTGSLAGKAIQSLLSRSQPSAPVAPADAAGQLPPR
jgi:hypothetical protein